MVRYIWLLTLVFSACSTDSPYQKIVERELAGEKRNDVLFMGLKFGQTDKEFYDYCRDLNKKGVFMQGTMNGGIAVQCKIDELTYPATMDFYPAFENDKIYALHGKIKYNAWAPWNKHLYADRLLPDIIQLFKKWYGGNDFIEVETPDKVKRWVKLDGNRRISIKIENDLFVGVEFINMLTTKSKELP